ncbi:thiamine pyrophosphate-dependent enzyme [Arhodomonas aquaeolei]|uniref:thiamine pyrophosphate-dependent enzyme n=1 Tax=Arhodomonas aquaeolei TaxID=2369 RepID=UPI0021687255|nr:thiamine pyrophosphate-dependent enzyme [Arhodomonas aquaeolei]MCS4505685.1 thiamine pyrophosphate-dependent enzyme [Arhodomonas aquaeolei]
MSRRILNGNELVIQGGLEAGFPLYTGYPGSPLADFFTVLHGHRDALAERGIRVTLANSEGNAAAMAAGAKQAGRSTLVAMKSMGLQVAADALSVGNFASPGDTEPDPVTGEPRWPGVVVVVGDDPWSMSTAAPVDSRYLYKHLHMPFLEPATPQELKDWIGHALTLSRRTSLYAGVLLTTFMAEGGGRVATGDWAEVPGAATALDPRAFDPAQCVMVPPHSHGADVRMTEERFPRVVPALEALDLDRVTGAADARIGFISAGSVYETLHQVMADGGHLEHVSLYKLASSWPLTPARLLPWLRGLDTVVVVEEKRGFLETELIEFCHDHGVSVRVHGKTFADGERGVPGFPAHGGLSYEIIRDRLNELTGLLGMHACRLEPAGTTRVAGTLPPRLPTFCPGCPHRETLSLMKELRRSLEREGVRLLSHGDVGCYSLSFLPPFGEMHDISAMGQGGALAAGMDSFADNPSVVLLGDSTFFHTGMTAISSSVQMGHDITYIVLDNDVTAMTGHQMDPRTGRSVEGRPRPRQDLKTIIRGMGPAEVLEVNPSDRYFYRNVLAETVRRPGTKVIISTKECALTYHARLKAADRKRFAAGETKPEQTFFRINTSACEDCRACIDATGCPGLSQTEDAYGTKMTIDPQICVSDGYCTQIMACPSFERVRVIDYHPTKYSALPEVDTDSALPEPAVRKTFEDVIAGNDWRVVVTGVGGSGVTTISRVLAEAATDMNGHDGLGFRFMDQKGLAQRNGRVTGHLTVHREDRAAGPITPMGTGDLVISPDLLDGSEAVGFLAPHGIAVVDETFQLPLSVMLDRGEDAPAPTAADIRGRLREALGERAHLAGARALTHRLLGRNVYASAMLLGVAYQQGGMPFTLHNLREAFARAVPASEFDANWRAFTLGRRFVVEGAEAIARTFGETAAHEDPLAPLHASLRDGTAPWERSGRLANALERATDSLAARLPEIGREHLGQYVHDLLVYDRGARLDDFLADAARLPGLYPDAAHQRTALRALARTYFIKDEVFVSHLLVSPLERERARRRYGHLGRSVEVGHINRPSFDVAGRRIEFDLNPRDWMLRTMRHLRVLRRVLPRWHRRENAIARQIREELLEAVPRLAVDERRRRLMQLDNVKGYRETRYEQAEAVLGAGAATSEFPERAPRTAGVHRPGATAR